MTGFYDQDLAYTHHTGYADLVNRSAPGLLGALRAAGIDSGTVVDLGCGGGLWLRKLSEAGFDTVGVDISPAMIDLARQEVPKAELYVGSVYDFDFPPCAAVTALGEVLSYCPNGSKEPPDLRPFLHNVSAALPPGGLFFFDVMIEGRGRPTSFRNWRADDDWAVMVDGSEEDGLISRDITTFRKVGEIYRRTDERHVQRVYKRREVEQMLRGAGFSVRALRRYGEYELAPRRLAFRARRR